MSKPRLIVFDDGTRAKVYKNYKRLVGATGSWQRVQMLLDMSSGFYDINYIKERDELLLVERFRLASKP